MLSNCNTLRRPSRRQVLGGNPTTRPSQSVEPIPAEPPIVAVGAWIWFDEALTPVQIVGSAVVVASLWGLVRSPELEHVEDDAIDPAPPT